jgi:Pentapeptide repeats (8 copies).
MSRVNLKGADLRGATLNGVDLKSLDLKGVKMDSAQAVVFLRSFGALVD